MRLSLSLFDFLFGFVPHGAAQGGKVGLGQRVHPAKQLLFLAFLIGISLVEGRNVPDEAFAEVVDEAPCSYPRPGIRPQ